MKFTFKVNMGHRHLRNVSLFLGGLALIRDGIDLAVNGGIERYERFPPLAGIAPYPDFGFRFDYYDLLNHPRYGLVEKGRGFVKTNEWQPHPANAAVLAYSYLQVPSSVEDIELVEMKTGSLEGVFKDILDRIANIFNNVFSSTKFIVRGEIAHETKIAVREIVALSQQPDRIKFAGIGLTMIGVEILLTSYMNEKVSTVEVQASESN